MAGVASRMIAVSLFAVVMAAGSAIAQDFTVGPYATGNDQNQVCPAGCQSYGATWDGTISTTTGNDFSCGCKKAGAIQQPQTTQQQQANQGEFPVGPFQLNQDRNAVCPSACQSYNATWNGGISTTTGNDFSCTCAPANQNVTQPQGVRPSTPPADRDSAGQQFIQPPTPPQPTTTQPTAPQPAAPQQAAGGDISGTLTQVHNQYRASHCASPVTWSAQIAQNAQNWAQQLQASNCAMQHSQMVGAMSENLAGVSNSNPDLANAVKRWYDEINLYDWSNPQRANNDMAYYQKVGHFMNVVWKGTTQIGCALALCPGRSQWGVLVCQYNRTGQDFTNANNVQDCRPR